MQQLVDGTWDLVQTNFDNVLYWSEDRGADLLVVSALESEPRQDLVVRPEIKTTADLKGKALAVDAAESGYVTPLRMMLAEVGLQEGDGYMLTEFGATNQRVDAMLAGEAFAAMVTEGRKLECGLHAIDSIGRLYTHYASIVVVQPDWADKHEDLLLRYLRAHLRANHSLNPTMPLVFAWDGLREMMEMRKKVGFLRGPVEPDRFATERYFAKAVGAL
jgi:ABC-type nitrate/sulfonate/bicarbonate transport system substrate-binding protein